MDQFAEEFRVTRKGRNEYRVTLKPAEIDFLVKNGVNPGRIRTLGELRSAERIIRKRLSQSIDKARVGQVAASVEEVKKWGIGARVKTLRRGLYYILALPKKDHCIRARRALLWGRIVPLSCEHLELHTPAPNDAVERIEAARKENKKRSNKKNLRKQLRGI